MRTLLAVLLSSFALTAQTDLPRAGINDPGIITTRQKITPAGTVTTFRGRVHGVVYAGASDRLEVLTANNLYTIDVAGNRIAADHVLRGRPGMQSLTPIHRAPPAASSHHRQQAWRGAE